MQPNYEPHRPVFKLAPADDERTQTILSTRRAALEDRNLDDGAARLFALVLDLSLNPSVNSGSGIVAISQTKLADKLGCSVRTIYDRTQSLVRSRYIWLSQIFMPNMKPMNVYHVTALHSPAEREYKTTAEGLWGNGSRVGPFQTQKTGSEAAVRQIAVGPASGAAAEKSQVLDIAAPTGSQLPLSTAESCRSHRQNSAAATGKILPLPPAESCRSHRQDSAAPTGKILPVTPATDCRQKESQIGDSDISRGEGTPPPAEKSFQDWLRTVRGTDQHPTHRSKLEKLAGTLREEVKAARTDEGREFSRRKLAAITGLLNPKHPAELAAAKAPCPAPAKKPALPKIPLAKARELLEANLKTSGLRP